MGWRPVMMRPLAVTELCEIGLSSWQGAYSALSNANSGYNKVYDYTAAGGLLHYTDRDTRSIEGPANTTTATALYPYNVALTNPAVPAGILNYQNTGTGRERMIKVRGIFDGSLFTLPGSDVHFAVSGEYMADRFMQRSGSSVKAGQGTSGLITARP